MRDTTRLNRQALRDRAQAQAGTPAGAVQIMHGAAWTPGSTANFHRPHKFNAVPRDYLPACLCLSPRASKPDISPGWHGDHSMKNFVLAAFAALSLTAAVAPLAQAASTIGGDAQATRMQQTGSYGQ
jgi:hypothetical protein